MKNNTYKYTDFLTDLQKIQSNLYQWDLDSLKGLLCINDRIVHNSSPLNLAISLFRSLDSESKMVTEVQVLVAISDSIYANFLLFGRGSNIAKKECLNKLILRILNLVEDILMEINKVSPNVFCSIKMSHYGMSLEKPSIRKQLSEISSKLIRDGISCGLRELLERTINRQTMNRKITYRQIDKIRKVLSRIKSLERINDEKIEKVLVLSDLDPPAVAGYLINRSMDSLLDKESLYDQAIELVKFKEDSDTLSILIGKYQTNEASITSKKLESYYRSQSFNMSTKIKLHRKQAIDQQNYQGNRKLPLNLPVSQFGLFIRLAILAGWIGEREVSKTFEFFSKNFSTPRAPIISPESLQKKSLDVEYSAAKKMKAYLIWMINHLNQHNNTSKP
ncbi:hypothetical protein [Sphingobacterium sp. 1.A.5]|uniref:hypothetical protein n=1 Tax=Sphingobacterium sp. 1.A.5 TaxID=2044604 RepID=UPI000C0BE6F1|nr:hypothetical protein [Sphingobacterium sp. 1.A.5]